MVSGLINRIMTRFILYGRDSEYSLSPLEFHLFEAGHEVIRAMNWTKSDFNKNFKSLSHFEKTILISSAHPGLNRFSGRSSIPIAELRNLGPWKKIGFFPHDLSEPFKWEERQYLNDYDFVIYEFPIPDWIESYVITIRVSGLKRNKIHLANENGFLFLPANFWSFGLGTAEEFLNRFPFTKDPRVVTKFHSVPEAHVLTRSLRQNFGIKILDPSLPGFELIAPSNGVLLTEGPSSVVTEAQFADMKCVFLSEKELSCWEKEKLKRSYPAILDFHMIGNPLPSIVNESARLGRESNVKLDIRNFLDFCQ